MEQKPTYKPYLGPRDRLKDGAQAPEMVYLPGGTFTMGDMQGSGWDRERPLHEVTLGAFAIGRYPVTVSDFQHFVQATAYRTQAERQDGAWVFDGKDGNLKADANWRSPHLPQNDDHPLVCISCNDATAYCRWLWEQTGEEYSLPSEAQWEYALRALS